MREMRLILIGLRGSGKSTLARELAARLSCAWVDLDDVTPRELGCATVAEAWSTRGEPAFRAAEAAALATVLSGGGARVIALGGGTPTAPGTAELLRAEQSAGRARVVYLRASAAALRERLRGAMGANRPSLTGGDPLAEIDEVFARRDEPYRRIADRVIEVDGMNERDAAEALERLAAE
jgi:shikimate kinase